MPAGSFALASPYQNRFKPFATDPIDWLEYLESLPNPPLLIVTSRLADERLWAEVLNLGAWDVLAKPFDDGEVLRTVQSTLLHYQSSAQVIAKPSSLTAAD